MHLFYAFYDISFLCFIQLIFLFILSHLYLQLLAISAVDFIPSYFRSYEVEMTTNKTLLELLNFVPRFLLYLNSSINPVIYNFMSG